MRRRSAQDAFSEGVRLLGSEVGDPHHFFIADGVDPDHPVLSVHFIVYVEEPVRALGQVS